MGHYLVFNGFNSEDYGIIISGAGTYATPERDVQAIPVPGRNGDVHFDNGRFNNIQVAYEAGIAKGCESKFLPFMDALLSAPIYSRLEDDYHPELYRLATFRAEMVPEVGTILRSGKFTLTFDCKPQRFLKAGEKSALTVEGTSASTTLVTEGIAEDICSAAFQTAFSGFSRYIAKKHITVINWHDLIGFGLELRLYYDNADYMYFGYGDSPASGIYSSGTNSGAPVYKPVMALGVSPLGDYHIAPTSSHPYVWFTTPSRWEIVQASDGTLIDSVYPDSATLVNPTKFPASPLLHIKLPASHVMTNMSAAMVGDGAIRMTFAANTITVGAYQETLEDVYIDCEAMDAYTRIGDLIYPLNGNVSLPTKAITLKPGENGVYTNSAIDSIEVIPNWWVI